MHAIHLSGELLRDYGPSLGAALAPLEQAIARLDFGAARRCCDDLRAGA